MLIAITTGKQAQDSNVISVAQASGATIIPISDYLMNGLPVATTAVIFSGILRGNARVMQEVQARGLDYYYIDHAYFHSGYKGPGWMRITKNGFIQNNIITHNSTRWEKLFKQQIVPYDFSSKRTIMILPPSDAVQKTFGVDKWLSKTFNKLKNYTDRKIVIRNKSGPILSDDLISQSNWVNYDYPPIDELWDTTYCVITYNSNAAIEALRRGIPVITSKNSAAWPVSNSIENIEKLIEYDRIGLFNSLSWGQFNKNEFANGYAFKYVNTKTQYRE